jgi:outer membrane protein
MKKIPLIANAVLAVAVIVLYVLFFTSKSSKSSSLSGSNSSGNAAATNGIVFINIDSVYAKYNMYKDVVGDLELKLNTAQAQFESKQRDFQKNVDDYKYKADRGLVTRTEAAQIEQGLQEQQQQLMTLQNQLQVNLQEEQQVAQRKVLSSVMDYLKNMEGAENYQFVLGNTFGSNIMYANDNLDITKKVTEGLNASYKKPAKEEN